MKKHLIVIGTAVLLLIVGLSGCFEQGSNSGTSGDTDKVELVSYTVTTEWEELDFDEMEENIVVKSGFYHNIPERKYGYENGRYNEAYYKIEVEVRNIAGEIIDVEIKAKFYDKNDNHLTTKTKSLKNIANTYTANYDFRYYENEEYFENVDSVIFEFKVL